MISPKPLSGSTFVTVVSGATFKVRNALAVMVENNGAAT
jgi:hypothetical protein